MPGTGNAKHVIKVKEWFSDSVSKQSDIPRFPGKLSE
jgi:hypothetical protein